MDISKDNKYNSLLEAIGFEYKRSKQSVLKTINKELVKTYWNIGKYIVEYEQDGKERAEYGSFLLVQLAKDLKLRYGKGFSRTNLVYIRLLYLKYPKSQTLSDFFGWSHYVELLAISNDVERSFYEKQVIIEKWSVRELKR